MSFANYRYFFPISLVALYYYSISAYDIFSLFRKTVKLLAVGTPCDESNLTISLLSHNIFWDSKYYETKFSFNTNWIWRWIKYMNSFEQENIINQINCNYPSMHFD